MRYARDHADDVYCMYDPSAKRIKISRDVRWMGKFYNDGHPIKIPDWAENNSRNLKLITLPIRYNDVQKENDSIQQTINKNNTLKKPTTNDVAEVVLVEEMDESYESPENFNDAWYNENPKLCLK